MKYIFIVNPIAGNGHSLEIIDDLVLICQKKDISYEVRYTGGIGDATNIAKEYYDKKYVIFSVGGDGTLAEVLNGVVGSKNMLGVIPGGSGNDFYKTLLEYDQGQITIDIGQANDIYFINIASIGIDAEVCYNLDKVKRKKIPRKLLYIISLLYTFVKYKSKKIKINENKTREISIFAVCNGKYYGNGFKIAPDASLIDNKFDIYIGDKMSKFKMPFIISKLAKGKHKKEKYITMYSDTYVSVSSSHDLLCQLDGEVYIGKKFDFKIIKKAITIFNNDNDIKQLIVNKKYR